MDFFENVLVCVSAVKIASIVHFKLLFCFQGVINAAPLAYIFPALCVMKLQNERLLSAKNIPTIVTGVFGILVAVIGFIMVIVEIANGVTCSHGKELSYCKSSSPDSLFNETSRLYEDYTTPSDLIM